MPLVTTRPIIFLEFSQNCPELCGILRGKKGFKINVFLYGNYPEMWETEGKFCGKNVSMAMRLFMYGNSVEMKETEGKFCGKNLGMEMSLFMCGNSAEIDKLREIMRGKTEAWK